MDKPVVTTAEKEAMWTDVYYHPDKWYDQRATATVDNKWPDFKSRNDKNVALWLGAKDEPSWVADSIGKRFERPPRTWTPPESPF